MKKVVLLSMMAVLFFTVASCDKNEDITDAKAKFTVKEKNASKPAATKAKAGIGTFTFTKAVIGISKVDFEIETGGNDNEYEYEGNYSFDILTGASTPPLPYVEIEPGTYHELEVKVDRTLPGGSSIEIEGTYTIAGFSYNFKYTSTLDEDYEIENNVGIQVDPNSNVTFTLYIDLPGLFNGVDFAQAVIGANNIIEINGNTNSDLAEMIEDNFNNAMDFDD